MEAFTSLKLDDVAASKKKETTKAMEEKHTFFAKFLTSEKVCKMKVIQRKSNKPLLKICCKSSTLCACDTHMVSM